ncbi:GGDEF domain-containing protein [Cetobacterium somerae]|uniref:GGDEF domain-containing protein n=1 Tax=Cetobacterium somerae TaxID=188913 RepID=UPI00211E9A08|nr:GGDEF domain-containing protein [Cetobacterium somerae]MCQ9626155.1 GGDEF domain-containing protein [Cetobacterium somerae]
MKMKSYNIFATFSAILITISLIFFLIIREKKSQEKESSFLNKITVSNNTIDFNKLTPLEEIAWEKFQKIPVNEYSYRYEEIAENNRVLLNEPFNENIGAYILKRVLKDGDLSPQAKLFVLNKLRVLDASSGNIVNSIKITMESLNLAEELNSEHDIIKAKIALSSIFNSLGGHNISIQILKDIHIENKDLPGISRTTISLYLYLAENYSFLNNTNEGFKYLNKITPLLKNEDEEYKKNVLILKNLLQARLYIMSNNKEAALQCLNIANPLLDSLKKAFFTDLKNLLLLTTESYYLKYEPNKFSPDNLKNFIKNTNYFGDITFLKIAFNLLFQYYENTENLNEYTKLSKSYDKYLAEINLANNKVFSMYLIENLEHERFAKENERLYKNMILLVISMLFILGVTYKRMLYLDKKARVDTLTTIRNRLAFKEDINSLKGNNYCMLLFDIDNFKKINDTFGHEFGDEVLSTIGKILKTIENKEISIYRIGGEEFAILFAHFNERFAMDSCEYIRKSIENIHWKYPITVTISGGFSKATKNTYAECDRRLYKAKSSGKNMIIYQHINEGDVK